MGIVRQAGIHPNKDKKEYTKVKEVEYLSPKIFLAGSLNAI